MTIGARRMKRGVEKFMPFVYRDVEELWRKPLAGSGTCVDIVKEYVPGLKGLPTAA